MRRGTPTMEGRHVCAEVHPPWERGYPMRRGAYPWERGYPMRRGSFSPMGERLPYAQRLLLPKEESFPMRRDSFSLR